MEAAAFCPEVWDEQTKDEKGGIGHSNDLRGMAVPLLAKASCSVSVIAAITGHTLPSATRILRRYLERLAALPEAAILMFAKAPATAFADPQ